MRVYLANGIFSESDQLYNKLLTVRLRDAFPGIEVYSQQENSNSEKIFGEENYYLDSAQILIAVIDGTEIDSDVAAKIGRFITLAELDKAKSRVVLGIYSNIMKRKRDNEQKINALIGDDIENQFSYRDLYVIGAIKKHGYIVSGVNELIKLMGERWNIIGD